MTTFSTMRKEEGGIENPETQDGQSKSCEAKRHMYRFEIPSIAVLLLALLLVVLLVLGTGAVYVLLKLGVNEQDVASQGLQNLGNKHKVVSLEKVVDAPLNPWDDQKQREDLDEQVIVDTEGSQQRQYDDICERSVAMQEELLDQFSGLDLCRAISPRELVRLRSLSIEESYGDRIRASDFQDMPNLTSLFLSVDTSNGASRLELLDGLSRHLGQLEELSLSYYTLRSLQEIDWAAEWPALERIQVRYLSDDHGSSTREVRFDSAGACMVNRSSDPSNEAKVAIYDLESMWGPLPKCP